MAGPTQEQLTDGDAAYGWVTGYLPVVAGEHAWSEGELAVALADADAAYADADAVGSGWFGYGVDATTFYRDLAASAAGWTGEGADKLLTVFNSAAGTAYNAAEAADTYDVGGLVYGTVEASVEDVEEAATVGRSFLTDWRTWVGVGAVAFLLALVG